MDAVFLGMVSQAPGPTLRPLMECCRFSHSHAAEHTLSFAAVNVLGHIIGGQILQWYCRCHSKRLKEGESSGY